MEVVAMEGSQSAVGQERGVHPSSFLKQPMFCLRDVCVRFGHLAALDHINLTINKGDFLFLTGSSGAGKTTLLRTLGGDVSPMSGQVLVQPEEPMIAKVFQDLRLMEKMRCIDNLYFSYDPQLYRSRREFSKDLKKLAKALNIEDRLHLRVRDANRGLAQKVAIVRALLARSQVLLADEPSSALDSENAFKIFDLLRFYNRKQGLTIVWASHQRELIKKFNGKIAHIQHGQLVHAGHTCFI